MSDIQKEVEGLEIQGVCPNCDTPNSYITLFCVSCGKKLPWADTVAGIVVNNTAAAPHSTVIAPISTGSQAHQTVSVPDRKSFRAWFSGLKWTEKLGIGSLMAFFGFVAFLLSLFLVVTVGQQIGLIEPMPLPVRAPAPAQPTNTPFPTLSAAEIAQTDKAAKMEQAQMDRKERGMRAFLTVINSEGNGTLLDDLYLDKNKCVVTANDTWHIQPYQYRLQRAQLMWATWGKIHQGKDADFSNTRLSIVDHMRNEVGGSNGLSGVWVAK